MAGVLSFAAFALVLWLVYAFGKKAMPIIGGALEAGRRRKERQREHELQLAIMAKASDLAAMLAYDSTVYHAVVEKLESMRETVPAAKTVRVSVPAGQALDDLIDETLCSNQKRNAL